MEIRDKAKEKQERKKERNVLETRDKARKKKKKERKKEPNDIFLNGLNGDQQMFNDENLLNLCPINLFYLRSLFL